MIINFCILETETFFLPKKDKINVNAFIIRKSTKKKSLKIFLKENTLILEIHEFNFKLICYWS